MVRDANVSAVLWTRRWSSTVFPRFGYDLSMQSLETGDDFDNMYQYLSDSLGVSLEPRTRYLDRYVKDFNLKPVKGVSGNQLMVR